MTQPSRLYVIRDPFNALESHDLSKFIVIQVKLSVLFINVRQVETTQLHNSVIFSMLSGSWQQLRDEIIVHQQHACGHYILLVHTVFRFVLYAVKAFFIWSIKRAINNART
jgi:hypothetical protein